MEYGNMDLLQRLKLQTPLRVMHFNSLENVFNGAVKRNFFI